MLLFVPFCSHYTALHTPCILTHTCQYIRYKFVSATPFRYTLHTDCTPNYPRHVSTKPHTIFLFLQTRTIHVALHCCFSILWHTICHICNGETASSVSVLLPHPPTDCTYVHSTFADSPPPPPNLPPPIKSSTPYLSYCPCHTISMPCHLSNCLCH